MLNAVITWVAILLNIWVSFLTNGDWQTAGSGLAGLYWNRTKCPNSFRTQFPLALHQQAPVQ